MSNAYTVSGKLETTKHVDHIENEENKTLSVKDKLMKIAPVVPYDVDLKFWGEEKIQIPSSQKFDSLHRFWKTNEHVDEFVPPQLLDSYRTRKINIVTKVEKITRKCRAPLPNGSLCERMDRHKCPFHGVIVPRNELGVPIDEGERKKVSCAGFLNL